jgi:nitrogen regulatory protein P-II 1
MTVSDVRGTGTSPEQSQWLGGSETLIALPVRSRVEVVVPNELTDAITDAILENAHTGEAGDGKIFIEDILDAVRVRTNERGAIAV